MKLIIIVLFGILCVTGNFKAALAQYYNNTNIAIPDSILKYNILINSAELTICKSDYTEALKKYDSAFLYRKSPFAIDQYNAAMCALLIKKYTVAEFFLINIVKMGYNYKLLLASPIKNHISPKRLNRLINTLDSTKVDINLSLKFTFDSLLNIDQKYRKCDNYYTIYHDTLCDIDYRNGQYLSKLIDEYGFPCESLIGVPGDLISTSVWEIIVIHNHPKQCSQRIDFTQAIEKAYLDGQISWYNAARYIEESSGEELFGTTISGLVQVELEQEKMNSDSMTNTIAGNYKFFNFSNSTIKNFNKSREIYAFESVEDTRKKMAFSVHNNVFLFSKAHKSIYSFSSKEDYENFNNNLISIE